MCPPSCYSTNPIIKIFSLLNFVVDGFVQELYVLVMKLTGYFAFFSYATQPNEVEVLFDSEPLTDEIVQMFRKADFDLVTNQFKARNIFVEKKGCND